MLHVLRLIHRWVGLTLAVLLGTAAVTGGLLLLKEPYHRWQHPRLGQPVTAGERAAWPVVLTAIESRHAAGAITLIKLPQPGMNAFQVWFADGAEAFVDPDTGGTIAQWTPWTSLPAFAFELHAHLLAEETGEFVNGVAALGAVFLGLSGALLWWPRRRSRFRLREAARRPRAAGEWMRSHAAVGALTTPAVLLFAVTGAGLVFYDQASAIVTRLDDAPAEMPSAIVPPRMHPRAPWPDVLAAVERTFAEGRTVFYYPGSGNNAVLTFRKRQPAEWHPNGRSYVLVDPYTARVVQAIDATAQGTGTRAMHALYPLHGAMVGGAAVVAIAVVGAMGMAWLSWSGVASYALAWMARRRARAAPASRRPSHTVR